MRRTRRSERGRTVAARRIDTLPLASEQSRTDSGAAYQHQEGVLVVIRKGVFIMNYPLVRARRSRRMVVARQVGGMVGHASAKSFFLAHGSAARRIPSQHGTTLQTGRGYKRHGNRCGLREIRVYRPHRTLGWVRAVEGSATGMLSERRVPHVGRITVGLGGSKPVGFRRTGGDCPVLLLVVVVWRG